VVTTGEQVSHTFAPGCYSVTLTVTDAAGKTGVAARTVVLTNAPVSTTPALVVDAHGQGETFSNLNGVLEPGEIALAEPEWRNNGASAAFTGLFSGPAGVLAVLDGVANYGTVSNGALSDCWKTGDCHRLYVDASLRPGVHWDLPVSEQAGATNRSWSLHVGASFSDVPPSHWAYPYVESLLHHGATAGCGSGRYCPASTISRESAAFLLIRSAEPPSYQPPACTTPPFNDVPCSNSLAPYIAEMKRRQISNGCGNGNYCPAGNITMAQLAVFVTLALNGPIWTAPTTCTQIYSDVPCSDPLAPYINELARRGITNGCGGGKFCPATIVTRDAIAPILVRAFGLGIDRPACTTVLTPSSTNASATEVKP
jgi:hypothetical protein